MSPSLLEERRVKDTHDALHAVSHLERCTHLYSNTILTVCHNNFRSPDVHWYCNLGQRSDCPLQCCIVRISLGNGRPARLVVPRYQCDGNDKLPLLFTGQAPKALLDPIIHDFSCCHARHSNSSYGILVRTRIYQFPTRSLCHMRNHPRTYTRGLARSLPEEHFLYEF